MEAISSPQCIDSYQFPQSAAKIDAQPFQGPSVTQFAPGQIVKHRKFNYRGVIFQADAAFELSEEWYEAVARSRPPKDAPWYHVLVDGGSHSTYVAERHLMLSGDRSQIEHPMLGHYFASYNGHSYQPHTVH